MGGAGGAGGLEVAPIVQPSARDMMSITVMSADIRAGMGCPAHLLSKPAAATLSRTALRPLMAADAPARPGVCIRSFLPSDSTQTPCAMDGLLCTRVAAGKPAPATRYHLLPGKLGDFQALITWTAAPKGKTKA